MTDLRERLDTLAEQAVQGAHLEHPRAADAKPTTARFGLAAAMAVVALVAIGGVGLMLSNGDGGDDGINRTRAVDPAEVDGDVTVDRDGTTDGRVTVEDLPLDLRSFVMTTSPDMDLSTGIVGPTVGDRTVYRFTSEDGSRMCHLQFADVEPGTDGSHASSACYPSVAVANAGFMQIVTEGHISGVVAEDVIGVDLDGSPAVLGNQMFLRAVDGPGVELALRRSPERTRLVAACDALGTSPDYGEAAGTGGDRPEASNRPASAVDPWFNTRTIGQAAAQCAQELVPGWAPFYITPGQAAADTPNPPTVDLARYGTVIELTDTDREATQVRGPGLSLLTRGTIADQDLVVFEWASYDDRRPQPLRCAEIQTPTATASSCSPASDERLRLTLGDDGPMVVHLWDTADGASFATATTADGMVYVQQAPGTFFVFAVPEGTVTLRQYAADGTELISITEN